MHCEKCGGEAPDSSGICPGCGASLYPPPLSAAPVQTVGFASSLSGAADSGSERQGQAGYAGQGCLSAPPPYAANPYGGSPYGQPVVPYHDPAAEPLTVWGFMWTMLVGFIPIVGWIIYLVWAFGGSKNLNRRNYAGACLLWMIIGVVLTVFLIVVLGLFGALLSSMQSR